MPLSACPTGQAVQVIQRMHACHNLRVCVPRKFGSMGVLCAQAHRTKVASNVSAAISCIPANSSIPCPSGSNATACIPENLARLVQAIPTPSYLFGLLPLMPVWAHLQACLSGLIPCACLGSSANVPAFCSDHANTLLPVCLGLPMQRISA